MNNCIHPARVIFEIPATREGLSGNYIGDIKKRIVNNLPDMSPNEWKKRADGTWEVVNKSND